MAEDFLTPLQRDMSTTLGHLVADNVLPDSYRPISLLTADVQILAKVLANRLSVYMQKLVQRD